MIAKYTHFSRKCKLTQVKPWKGWVEHGAKRHGGGDDQDRPVGLAANG